MKLKQLVFMASLVVAMPVFAASSPDAKFQAESSYAIGVNLGKTLKAQEITVNVDSLTQGVKDGIQGGPYTLTDEEMQKVLLDLHNQVVAKQKAEINKESVKNATEGDGFLQKNAKLDGVTTTKSGLQYKVLTKGDGAKPLLKDLITVDYEGTFIDGKVFDSSYTRGKPSTFPLAGMIPGWQEILPMMPVGSTWNVYVPAKLAYGERGVSGFIGPNETLIFKIHLIDIKKNKS